MSQSTKRFYIENLGCSKNQVDAEQMISSLISQGWEYTGEDPEQADLIIVNTCGFINAAKEEAVNTLLDFRRIYPDKKIMAAGCLSQRYGSDLMQKMPELDGVFGNKSPGEVSRIADDLIQGKKEVLIPEEQKYFTRREFLSFAGSAYVKISEGCRNCCNFCAIPLIRGDINSRPLEEVVSEIESLISKGIFEINLVAQDLANFGLDRGKREFVNLLERISALEGDFWVRLLYIHPDHFPLEILELMKRDPRILPYFDIPFQHGSERILQRMGRAGNSEIYLKLIKTIRKELPRAVIRSTFLVGFPGEGGSDFNQLLEFQKRARLDWVGVFTYSREEGTKAFQMGRRPGSKTAEKRKKILEQNQQSISEQAMSALAEREDELTVLLEEPVEGEDLYLARCYAQAPEVDGLTVLHASGGKPGMHIKAKILRCNGIDLEASPV